MVGARADNADADTVALIPASESIDNVDAVSSVEVVDSTLTVNTPNLRLSVSDSSSCIVTSHGMQDLCKRIHSQSRTTTMNKLTN